jgi:hypothetical protein
MAKEPHYRREIISVLPLTKKRGWHYHATIEMDRTIAIYASAPDDTMVRDPQLVPRSRCLPSGIRTDRTARTKSSGEPMPGELSGRF